MEKQNEYLNPSAISLSEIVLPIEKVQTNMQIYREQQTCLKYYKAPYKYADCHKRIDSSNLFTAIGFEVKHCNGCEITGIHYLFDSRRKILNRIPHYTACLRCGRYIIVSIS